MLNELLTTFEDRLSAVREFLTTKPDNSDKHIAHRTNTLPEFVRKERAFMGLPPYVKPKIKKRVVEPITEPQDLQQSRRAKRGRGYSRNDVWDKQKAIKKAYFKGAEIKQIAQHLSCSEPLIRRIIGL